MALNCYDDVLNSYIEDDDKLVTYKWLSKELALHVNVAKDILNQYWKKYKDTKKLIATILLVGRLNDQSIRVEVVKDKNLNSAKTKFLKVDCEHVYSLQKSLENVELLAFAGEGDFQYSAIKYNNDYIRDNEETDELKIHKNLEIIQNCEQSKEKDIQINKKNNKLDNNRNIEVKKSEKSTTKDIIKESESEIKEKTSDKSLPVQTKSKVKSDNSAKKPIQSKQSGFNNLFGKVPQVKTKPNSNNDKETDSNIGKGKQEKGVQEKKKVKNDQVKKDNVIEKQKEDTNLISTNKNDGSRKKRNRSQDNVISKRKRIVIANSSDESENSGQEEEEEEEAMQDESTKEEQPRVIKRISPPRSVRNVEDGKHIVRKTVDKTFKDADGYLVTKRVHTYEVATDNEKSEEVKTEQPPKSKSVEVKTKKQSTLTNFFKKA